ncbi:MAG: TonB-dependent receptor [Bryobacterales bacterium]|nr:TonB-dependent receptor [Bryobacterales bacterium]
MRSLLWLFFLACPIYAQSTLGVILGNVSDPSGASVSGAKVKITNLGENVSRQADGREDGSYDFQNVKPGVYSVEVTKSGFRSFIAKEVTLVARQTLRVDAQLQVGEVTQTVEVTAVAGVIATDTGSIASALSPEKVASLPANFRASTNTTPYNLLQTLPGVQADNGIGLAIQGGLPAQSESSSDGISITSLTGNSANRNLFPSIESIGEIRVQGVGNAAEFGQPGDVTIVSKGGTNAYHGAAFWYHQNKAFDALTFGQTTLPAKVSNNFGGTLGGPLRIPKLYNGTNRTFFQFSWESLRYPRQSTVANTLPSQRLRQGDFTAEGVTVRDPLTGQPFAGNVIPASRINAVARAIIPLYPAINVGDGTRRSVNNFIQNRIANIESNQFDVRIDQTISPQHAVFGRYTWKKNPTLSPNNLTLPSDTNNNDHQQLVASHTWTIRPTLLNEVRGGYSYAESRTDFPFDGRAFTNSLNLKDIQRDIFFNGLPNFSIDQYTSFNKGRPGFSVSKNIQFIDNLTWIRGKHTFKFGGDIRKLQGKSALGFTTGNNYGDFGFNGTFAGNSWADFLLGTPASSSIAVLSSDNDGRATHYKFYAQDSWRLTNRLTLEYGIRYEFHPGYYDAGFNIANFDRSVPRTGRVIVMSDPKARELVAPGAITSFNGCPGAAINGVPCTPIVTAEEAGLPEGLRENYYTQFLPRLGFAYRLDNKTTLRASGGVYNMITLGSVFFSLTGTVQSDVRNFNNVGADGKPVFTLPDTRTPGSGIRSGAVGTFEFRTANQIDFHPPRMVQWSMSVDRQLSNTTGLRLSYIGNKSTHMPWAPDVNQMAPDTRFFSQRPNTDRPFPNWGLIFSRDAGANTNYNSFQVELNRRFAKGLSFTSAYTLAKALGDNQGPASSSFSGETGGGRVTNSLNRAGDRGDIYAFRRHRALLNLVYELPFGKGRMFMNNANRLVDTVLGGWQISSILTLQSGPFLTPTVSVGDPSGTNATSRGTQRPDRVGNGSVDNPTAARWLDRSAFYCPGRAPGAANQWDCLVGVVPGRDVAPIGRFGNSGVGIVVGPGTFAWNMGMMKQIPITEKLSFKIEGSFTNLPNWNNLGDPVMNVNDNAFGVIRGARGVDFGGGRVGQIGARLQF